MKGVYGLCSEYGQFFWPYYAYNRMCRIEVEDARCRSPAAETSSRISEWKHETEMKKGVSPYETITTIHTQKLAQHYTLIEKESQDHAKSR